MNATGPAPYFQLPGTARQALEHWQRVFGGEVQIATYADFSRTDGPADAVAHGQLTGELALFAADASGTDSPFAATGLLFSLLGAAAPDVLRRWFDQLAEGGVVVDPLQERPWGDWDGTVRDAHGVTWLIGFEASAR
ncbi:MULTISPECIES: VOC family protein [Curtobacterium]|uniref:VOC family protein n=1 Tax=Curtobacterium TaxID=2034 RepID=UPI0018E56255|nr:MULTISPECIES: VOC family protein [Curtobacterium]MCA5924589.1 VOC family protein [Curtobacterium oceanosedimentum]QQD76802.1 VOC family protein [Curtobacterium sp. YC1]